MYKYIVTGFTFLSVLIIYISSTIPTNAGILIILVACILLRLVYIRTMIPKRDILFWSFFCLCFAYIYWAVLVRDSDGSFSPGFELRITLAPIYVMFFYIIFKDNVYLLRRVVRYFLVFCVIAWIVQFMISYGTGQFFDYLDILGLRDQRGEAYMFKHLNLGFKLWRPTGVFNEPGTYAMVVYQLLVLDYLFAGQKISKLHKVTLVTFLLSMSSFSILLATLFFAIVVLSKRLTLRNAIFLLLSTAVLGFSSFLYIKYRFEGNFASSGLEFRTVLFLQWISQGLIEHLFGNSFSVVEIYTEATGDYDVFVEDLSFLFYLSYHLGAVFVVLFIMFLKSIVKNWESFLVLSVILFSKVNIISYFLWITLISAHLISTRQSYNN